MSEIVTITDAVKTFRRGSEEIHAIDGVDLSIEQGELLMIVGPSGSGKTTLLNLIGCIDVPTTGEVVVRGMETGLLTEKALATIRSTTIGFVFQQFFLVPTLSAIENVMLPGRFSAGGNREELEETARILLSRLELSDRADHLPSELSGGEMQRVAIARALINNPEIILADEPTGNLDMKSASEIVKILEELNSEGLTIVIVSHNPELVAGSNRLLKLRDGKIVEEQKFREVDARLAQDGETRGVLLAPAYMPAKAVKKARGSWRVASGIVALSVGLFATSFMPFVGNKTGSGLLSQGLFTTAIYRGSPLTGMYYGKPATVFTGIWPMFLALMMLAAGLLFFLKRKVLAGWLAVAAGGVAALIATVNLVMIASRLSTDDSISFMGMAPGYGLWGLLGLGLISVLLGVVILLASGTKLGRIVQ